MRDATVGSDATVADGPVAADAPGGDEDTGTPVDAAAPDDAASADARALDAAPAALDAADRTDTGLPTADGGPALTDAGPAPACLGGTDRDDLTPAAMPAPTCAAASYVVERDVAYVAGEPDPTGPHRLDLYRPLGPGPFRTVVWIHGGAWRSGDEDNVQQAIRLVCRGFAVASIDYRLTSEGAVFPQPLHDVRAAVRFLRAQAATYDLDPTRFAAFGSSAGGHLAALLGTTAGITELDDPALGNAGFSSAVQAVVDWYGPTDFEQMDAQLLAQSCPASAARHSEAGSGESDLVGCVVGEASCADEVARANPITHVDPTDTPFLMIHGTADCISPRAQSALLAEALRSAGVCVSEHSLVGAEHGGPGWVTAPPQARVADFLDRTLR